MEKSKDIEKVQKLNRRSEKRAQAMNLHMQVKVTSLTEFSATFATIIQSKKRWKFLACLSITDRRKACSTSTTQRTVIAQTIDKTRGFASSSRKEK